MCKILTPKEKESLNKLTRLVEGLTKKKVILESKPDCHCCDKKPLREGLMSGASEETKSRDVEESDKEHIETKQKRNKLAQEKYKKDYKELGEEQKNIVNKKLHESKQELKEGVWALPKDAVARRKAMNFKQELQRIKNDIYDIAGSDELFDRLDGAITELDNLITAGKSQSNV